MSNMIRTLARNRAKENMRRKGMRRIFEHGYFAANWKEWVIVKKGI